MVGKRLRRQISKNIERLEQEGKNPLQKMCGVVLSMVFEIVMNIDDRLAAVEGKLGMAVDPFEMDRKEED